MSEPSPIVLKFAEDFIKLLGKARSRVPPKAMDQLLVYLDWMEENSTKARDYKPACTCVRACIADLPDAASVDWLRDFCNPMGAHKIYKPKKEKSETGPTLVFRAQGGASFTSRIATK